MAKTFDNISEASATNYLFLVAQRTLALQNEPPTPPPLNALGLLYLLWEWARKQKQKVKHAEAAATCDKGDGGGDEGEGGGYELGSVAEEKKRAEANAAEDAALKAAEAAEEVDAALKAVDALKAAAEAEVAGKMQLLMAAETAEAPADDGALKRLEGAAAAEGGAAASGQQQDTGKVEAASEKETTDKAHSVSPNHDAPLAKKITEYILDSQDDSAQEERWRTTMKRETMKRFREQREHANKIQAGVQKVEAQIEAIAEAQRENMKRFQALDEKMDQLIKNTTPAQH